MESAMVCTFDMSFDGVKRKPTALPYCEEPLIGAITSAKPCVSKSGTPKSGI